MYTILFIEYDTENIIDTSIREEEMEECKKILLSLESIIGKDNKRGYFKVMKLKDKNLKNKKGRNMNNSQFIVDAQKLFELFEVQHTLNTITCGENWYISYTCERTEKQMEYDTAFLVETIEFLDSFNWKHWKHGKDDIENAKVELVDLLHFILSLSIIKLRIVNEGKIEFKDFINDIENKCVKSKSFAQIKAITVNMLKNLFKLTDNSFIGDRTISARYIFDDLFKLMNIVGMTFDDMYDLYIGKNALNYVRLNNGYQDGTYQKIWDGKEDNAYMQEKMLELKTNDNFSFQTLKKELESKYLSMLN